MTLPLAIMLGVVDPTQIVIPLWMALGLEAHQQRLYLAIEAANFVLVTVRGVAGPIRPHRARPAQAIDELVPVLSLTLRRMELTL